jgi:hypothetical protein
VVKLGEALGPDGYVSAATTGAAIGALIPPWPAGIILGSVVGGIVDVFWGAKKQREQRKAMKRAFMRALLKRYNSTIFVSSLEKLGMSMMYLQSLGLKPGTPDFDKMLQKKAHKEIGYKGDCAIDLLGPVGGKRKVVASIDSRGTMKPYTPHIDLNLGLKWKTACKELHKVALKAWAEDQAQTVIFQRDIEKEKAIAARKRLTRILVNAGAVLLFLGYTLRQKKKVQKLRQITRPIKERRRKKRMEAIKKKKLEGRRSKKERPPQKRLKKKVEERPQTQKKVKKKKIKEQEIVK